MSAKRVHLEQRDPTSPLMIHQLIEQGILAEETEAHRIPGEPSPAIFAYAIACTADDIFPWRACKPNDHFWMRAEATLEICDKCERGRYIPSPIRWETVDEFNARLDAEEARDEMDRARREAHA